MIPADADLIIEPLVSCIGVWSIEVALWCGMIY